MMKLFLIIIFFLVNFSQSLLPASSLSWSFTNQIQAGIKIIVQNQAHLDLSSQYVYTYSPAFSSTPNTALGIPAFEVYDLHQTNLKFKIVVNDFTSTTQLTVKMVNASDTQWRHFKASYIAIDSAFNDIKTDYFEKNVFTNISTGVGTRTFSGVFVVNIGPLDLTNSLTIIPFLSGIDSSTVSGEHTVFITMTLNDAYTILYDITVKHTTRVHEIYYYVMIVDQIAGQQGYQVFYDHLQITGKDNIQDSFTALIDYDPSNILLGLTSFEFTLAAFSIDTSFTLTSQGYYNQIKISVWSFRQRNCILAQPYYEIVSNDCYSTCPNNSIDSDGPNDNYCQLCGQIIADCQYCSGDASVCDQCWGNYQLSITNTSCTCPDGYYQSSLAQYQESQLKCRICHSFCLTCSESTQNDCITCPERRTFNGSYCVCDAGAYPNGQCQTLCNDTNCIRCDNDTSICQQCAPTFLLQSQRCVCGERRYYDSLNTICLDCHPTCLYCDGPLSNNCIFCSRSIDLRYLDLYSQCQCISNYEQTNQTNGTCVRAIQTQCLEQGYYLDTKQSKCFQICGDGILHELQCDDNNNNNGDGCSSNCEIEDGFMCADNTLAPNSRSYCSFIGQIDFKVKWIHKDLFSNQLNITYTMEPVLQYIFQVYYNLTDNTTYQPRSYKISTKQALYNIDTKEFSTLMEYNDDLQGQAISLVFRIPQTAQTFAIPVSRQSHRVNSDNVLAAVVYDDLTYQNVRIISIIGKVCYIGAIIMGVVLMFFRKMMALQLIVMFQLVYFGILLAQYSHPFLGPIQQWDYINGYNQLMLRSDQPVLVDNLFRVYSYYTNFLDNCNVMIFLNLSLYVLSLIVFLLSYLTEKVAAKKFVQGAKFLIVQIGFALMVFSCNNIIVSLGMEVYSDTIGDFQYTWSKVFMIISLIIFIFQIVLFFFHVHTLTDSSLYYKKHKEWTHYYPMIFLLRNILLIISIILVPNLDKKSSIFALVVQGTYLLVVLISRPFRKPIDWVRFALVQLTLLGFIIARFVESNYIQIQFRGDWGRFFLYSAFLIIFGLIISFVFTMISFIYHFCRGLKKDKDQKKQEEYQPQLLVKGLQKEKEKEKIKDKEDKLDQSDSKQLLSPVKNNEKQQLIKSKQLLILDVEDDQTGGSVPNNSIYQQSTRRKFTDEGNKRSKKKKQKRSFNPYV